MSSCRHHRGQSRRELPGRLPRQIFVPSRLLLMCRSRGAATGLVRHARARSRERAPPRRRTVEAIPTACRHAQAGIVSGLWRYPVKSMAGEALASTEISWAGLAGDRRWAFVRPDSQNSGFPWHTIREFPQMSNYAALLTEA